MKSGPGKRVDAVSSASRCCGGMRRVLTAVPAGCRAGSQRVVTPAVHVTSRPFPGPPAWSVSCRP
eukprot:3621841-Rhodomonas_salina.2